MKLNRCSYITISLAAFLIVLGACSSGLPQYNWNELRKGVKVLGSYDFSDGGYKLVGVHYGFDNNLSKTIGEFYIEDKAVLNKIKNEWTFYKKSKYYKCGYHYEIKLLRNGDLIDSFSINLEDGCNAIVTSIGPLVFDPSKLEMFRNDLKPLLKVEDHFKSLIDGRSYIKEAIKSNKYVYGEMPLWKEYDGYFSFQVEVPPKFDLSHLEESTEHLQNELINTYGQNAFVLIEKSISFSGGQQKSNDITYEIICNKELFMNFHQYKVIQPWKTFDELEWVHWQKTNVRA
jgi:hypothetical protein